MDLSGVEWGAFAVLVGACLATLPAVIAHVRGTSSRIDQVAGMMASSPRLRARVAGGMHLTWGNVFFGSLGVVFAALGWGVTSDVLTGAFVIVMALDLSVVVAGRPSVVVLPRHREAARRRLP